MAERVGHFCFALLAYQLDKTDETDEDEKDETDEDDEKDEEDEGGADEDGLDHILEVSQVNSMLVHLLLKIIPVSLEVMHICSTILEASKSAELGCFNKKLLEESPDIRREHLIHL
ncbi:G-patch domain-containing protein 1-like [Capsicum annuum]|uniref:G-patch domain-containing protein 1-like n=1 Tax=Capsicum annuum TaxID=4072 RepID=UPI001FB0D791|nr:G-patch domain-containing protein 1-like [Capsicum annuum]